MSEHLGSSGGQLHDKKYTTQYTLNTNNSGYFYYEWYTLVISILLYFTRGKNASYH